ncbi:MAG: molybdopterin-dependent oxidoreductase [Myxococcota bacterium]|nr:molybdopterin-dependent oxidoreductase [Myxococcota bacterium]
MTDFDRRDFLKLVGVSAGAAAAAGCADHVESLIPYVVQPEEVTPGNAVIYASTCTECPAACGLHVRTRESRPIKLEGNPEHPVNRGKLCGRAQASVGRTYSPDRFKGPVARNEAGELEPISWDDAVARVADALRADPGKGHVLGGDPGPTAGDLVDRFVSATGLGGRTVYEPLAHEALREASRQVFGVASEPIFDLSDAHLIIDFGAEFLEDGPSTVEHAAQWAAARDVAKKEHGGARTVYVGSRLSLTASSSDEWLTAKPGTEGILALALAGVASRNGGGSLPAGVSAPSVESAAEIADVDAEAIERIGKALGHGHAVALPPAPAASSRRAVATNAAVLILNQVVGAVGTALRVPPAPTGSQPSYRETLALIEKMKSGGVNVLLVHDSNPVYSLPKAAGFEAALENVGLVVSFATSADETAAAADLILPDHAPMESWGDRAPRPGARSVVQPTFRPLYDTRALGDTLLDVGRAIGEATAARLPTGSFRSVLEEAWSDTDWRKALSEGGVFGELESADTSGGDLGRLEFAAPALSDKGEYTLLPFATGLLHDGRGANLPWLQEIPDPVTHVAWDSWAEVSLATAEKLGVEIGDLIEIQGSAEPIKVPVFPRGGIRDDVVAVPLGQGHTVGTFASREVQGLPGTARGVNVADALPPLVDEGGGRAWLTEKVALTATGEHRRLPLLQFSDNKRKRELGEVIDLADLAGNGHGDGHGDGHGEAKADAHGDEHAKADDHGSHGDGHGDGHGGGHDDHGGHEILEDFDPADDAADEALAAAYPDELSVKASPYRWGLTVDLDRCTGCSSCIVACYVENNIPMVGEDETRRVRQMAWLRIDRFVGEGEVDYPLQLNRGDYHPRPSAEKLGDTDIRNSPMMCQQCGAAPCEPVCPVIATYHNEEGLNAMIYNRCIGTRYCANNCPYKVRRFNYFDNQITKWPAPMELGLNPDVTVRGQGVMEKCNFCVQRVQTARQIAKNEGREILDGEVQTACQQTCPTDAIGFGNLRDDQSEVSKRADDPRSYYALQVLNTRPGVTYLKKVRRGKIEG